MHTLRKQALAIVSVAAALVLLLLLSPSATHSQTTYSSPVRVTNTPLPVSGAVSVTAGANLPVTIQGTPTVNVGNTTLSTVSGEQYYTETHSFGPFASSIVSQIFSPTTNLLLESASVDCTVPAGQRVLATVKTYITGVVPHALPLEYQGTFDGNDHYSGTVALKAYHKAIQGFMTVSMSVDFTKNSVAGNLSCSSTLEGTVKP